jgi:hypothetical protein
VGVSEDTASTGALELSGTGDTASTGALDCYRLVRLNHN